MKVESAKSLMLLTVVSIALTVLVIPLKIQQDIAYERYIQGLNISGTVVDYPPSWYIWGIGPLVMIMGLFAVISWIFSLSIVINLTIRKNNKSLSGRKSLVALLLIPLLLTIITSGYVYKTTNAVETKSEVLSTDKAFTSTSDTTVNALFAGDEEFMSSSVLWGLGTKPLPEIVEQDLFPAYRDQFATKLGINILFSGWATWDSDDGTTHPYWMLQEAIREIGGTWVTDPSWANGGYWRFNKGMLWNGVVIDLLIAWTFQGMEGRGLAPFPWGVAIIRFDSTVDRMIFSKHVHAMLHETSHLYDLQHCSDLYCLMHPDNFYGLNWCSTCKDYMIAHKDYFTRTIDPPVGGISIPVNKIELMTFLLAPWTLLIGTTVLISIASIVSVVLVKRRKKSADISPFSHAYSEVT